MYKLNGITYSITKTVPHRCERRWCDHRHDDIKSGDKLFVLMSACGRYSLFGGRALLIALAAT